MNKLFQTATTVHDEKQSDLSRRADHMREGAIMLGMTVFSQLLAFSALYMLPVLVTAALAAACEELEKAGTRIKHMGGSGPDKISVI